MTSKVRNLLESLNIPSSTYHAVLTDFDDTLSQLNDMLISTSTEAEQSKSLLYDVQNKMEVKESVIESLELQLRNVTIDSDFVRTDNMLVK